MVSSNVAVFETFSKDAGPRTSLMMDETADNFPPNFNFCQNQKVYPHAWINSFDKFKTRLGQMSKASSAVARIISSSNRCI